MLLRAYALSIFPMAERRDDDEVYWVDPERRGILPLDKFHLPRRLARELSHDAAPDNELAAEWIGILPELAGHRFVDDDHRRRPPVIAVREGASPLGYGHSVECWRKGELVGGLYGIALGGAFFGESMFSRERDASKVALVHLVLRLQRGGFRLLDTQFITHHLAQFGAIELGRSDYRKLLADALAVPAQFYGPVAPEALASFLQSSTQRS